MQTTTSRSADKLLTGLTVLQRVHTSGNYRKYPMETTELAQVMARILYIIKNDDTRMYDDLMKDLQDIDRITEDLIAKLKEQ